MQVIPGPKSTSSREALTRELGDDAASFPVLARAGAAIDDEFLAAVRRWQGGVGIIADGVVGPRCQVLLGMIPPQGDKFGSLAVNVGNVSRLFPATKPANIARYLPYIEAALGVAGLTDRAMVRGRARHHPRRDRRLRADLRVPVEVQHPARQARPSAPTTAQAGQRRRRATARAIAVAASCSSPGATTTRPTAPRSAVDLDTTPDLANAPGGRRAAAGRAFSPTRRRPCRDAVAGNQLDVARRLVNGGSHGLTASRACSTCAEDVWPTTVGAGRQAAAARQRVAAGALPRASTRSRARRRMPPTCATGSSCRRRSACRTSFRPSEDVGKFLPALHRGRA